MMIFAILVLAAVLGLAVVANIDYWSMSAAERKQAEEDDWNW